MRHQKHGRTLGRKSSHRKALWSNMVCSLITHERVQTTDAKAKELRRIAERAINWSASLGDVLTKDREKLDAEDRARLVHAMRMARRVVKQADALEKGVIMSPTLAFLTSTTPSNGARISVKSWLTCWILSCA